MNRMLPMLASDRLVTTPYRAAPPKAAAAATNAWTTAVGFWLYPA